MTGRQAGDRSGGLRRHVAAVVDNGNCSGCGACAAISSSIQMGLDSEGFSRPVWIDQDEVADDRSEVSSFLDACPGVVVRRSAAAEADQHDPVLGSYVSAWTGWASDAETRWRGSSGGVLTALSAWLLETGQVVEVIGAAMSEQQRRRTVAVRIQSPGDTARMAGSRYAPVGTAALFDPQRSDTAFIGKPCEVAAARRMAGMSPGASTDDAPVLLSFFCAGVPSQHATDRLVDRLGVDPQPSGTVRYRGQGWPGSFVVDDGHGRVATSTYEESWGQHLGRHLQDRCKICPDGLGGDADIAVGDFWLADDAGYPSFEDSPGRSVVIARTRRGHALLLRAADEDVVRLGSVTMADVAAVQPLQRNRQAELAGRLAGRRLAGRRVPRYPGFHLLGTALRAPLRTWRAARGSYIRARRAEPLSGPSGREH